MSVEASLAEAMALFAAPDVVVDGCRRVADVHLAAVRHQDLVEQAENAPKHAAGVAAWCCDQEQADRRCQGSQQSAVTFS